jgi:hypothetical protein
VDAVVESDGAGEITIDVIPDSDVMDALADTDIQGLVSTSSTLRAERTTIDGREGFRISVPFRDPDELGQLMVAGATFAGQQISLFSEFTVQEIDYGAWRLNATPRASAAVIAGPSGESLSDDELLALAERSTGLGLGGVQMSNRSVDFSITLPGALVSSNASDVDGTRATWRLTGGDVPEVLVMETEPKQFPTPAQAVVAVGAVGLLLGVVLLALGPGRRTSRAGARRRKRVRTQARPAQGWSAAGPDGAGEPPAVPLPSLATPPAAPPAAPSEEIATGDQGGEEPAPGWYPDPAGTSAQRYWDGADWTDEVR